jgi:G:T-mismatch repair DNA endonuclease (very short patch repair protein)
MKKKCPFCGEMVNPGNHFNSCARNMGFHLSNKEIRFRCIECNFPFLAIKKNIQKLYINEEKTLPEFRNEFGISYKEVTFLLDYFLIKKRSIKDGTNLKKTRDKYKKTCLDKYGAENSLSKGTEPYKKRNETVKKEYGVDNVFQLDEVKEKIWNEEKCINKWGLTRRELISKNSKKMWDSLNEEERENRISKALKKSIEKRGYMSSLEETILNSLQRFGFSFISQYFVKLKNQCFFFDFLIRNLNILIEVQGDYWHANPLKYKRSDLISYPEKIILAEDVWKKDLDKRKKAENKGFKVMYLWESELIKIKNESMIDYILLKKILETLNEN